MNEATVTAYYASKVKGDSTFAKLLAITVAYRRWCAAAQTKAEVQVSRKCCILLVGMPAANGVWLQTAISHHPPPLYNLTIVDATTRAFQVVFDEKMKGNFSHTLHFHFLSACSRLKRLSSICFFRRRLLNCFSFHAKTSSKLITFTITTSRLLLLSSPLHFHFPLSFSLSTCQLASRVWLFFSNFVVLMAFILLLLSFILALVAVEIYCHINL